jgi:hypothetical protein
MRRIRSIVLCLAIIGLAAGVRAQKLEPVAEFVHEDAAGKLGIIGKVAVVLTGDAPFLCRVAEDVVAISLMNAGVKVAYPDETYLGKPRDEKGRSAEEIAKAAGANVLVTGTLVSDAPDCSGCGQGGGGHNCPGSCRSSKVSMASLSVVDVPFSKTLVWALYEPENPVSGTRICQAFCQKMLADLK